MAVMVVAVVVTSRTGPRRKWERRRRDGTQTTVRGEGRKRIEIGEARTEKRWDAGRLNTGERWRARPRLFLARGKGSRTKKPSGRVTDGWGGVWTREGWCVAGRGCGTDARWQAVRGGLNPTRRRKPS